MRKSSKDFFGKSSVLILARFVVKEATCLRLFPDDLSSEALIKDVSSDDGEDNAAHDKALHSLAK